MEAVTHDGDAATEVAPTVADATVMTKTAMKKAAKRAALKQHFKEKKARKKEEKRARREESLKDKTPLELTPAAAAEIAAKRLEREAAHSARQENWTKALSENPKVIIDCDFLELMTNGEMNSLSQQISHCYGYSRRSDSPLSIHVGTLKGYLKNQLNKVCGFNEWPITTSERNYEEDFDVKDLVYLTADSENVIETLESNKVYVIGGIVDRNRHKFITLNRAKEKGITTARLPIGDLMKIYSSPVLTVNHVYGILLKYHETKDWKAALEAVLPRRKATGDSHQSRLKKRKRDRDDDQGWSDGDEDGEEDGDGGSASESEGRDDDIDDGGEDEGLGGGDGGDADTAS